MITEETLFRRMLSLERRRCERAGTRFALLLLDMEELRSTFSVSEMEGIGLEISRAMRETDVTGWFRQPSTIGVILTTLNGTERQILEPIVMERVRGALALHLDTAQMQRVWISCHVFPEDTGTPSTSGELERIFYSGPENTKSISKGSGTLKRAMDIAGSLAALIVVSPLLLTIAAFIKATSFGPILFKQKRIGQFGKEFTFLKFRSMEVNNDPAIHQEYIRNLISKSVHADSPTFKIKNDPRVTAIGRVLRKSSFDELPQFINVLKGEMSLVGPRPPIPYEFENYSLWHRRRVLEARPGITGAWQVEGRSRTTFDEMVRMDLRYIQNQSLWLDLKILLKTPRAVISGDGAF